MTALWNDYCCIIWKLEDHIKSHFYEKGKSFSAPLSSTAGQGRTKLKVQKLSKHAEAKKLISVRLPESVVEAITRARKITKDKNMSAFVAAAVEKRITDAFNGAEHVL